MYHLVAALAAPDNLWFAKSLSHKYHRVRDGLCFSYEFSKILA